MTKSGNKIALIVSLAVVLAVLTFISVQTVLAQSTATIVGQVAVNGTPTNGVLVTCGPSSNTTFTYNGTPGYYFIGGLPYGTSLPFKATYQGYSYTDTVDPLSTGQQYYQIPTVSISLPAATVAPTAGPTAVPNATVTPAPNATATPAPNATATPAPNATATPAPNATATPAPNSTITPTPGANASTTITPVPPAPTAIPPAPTSPVVTIGPLVVTVTPVATPIAEVSLVPTPEPVVTAAPTAVPKPTQTKSPGFEGLFALSALLGATYLVLRKGR